MANAGFTNSDGCTDCPMALIQRRAPFTSAPYLSVAHSARMLTTSANSATNRTCRAVSSEAPTMTAIEGMANPHWRTMKKYQGRCSRSATDGLAAKLSTTPHAINRIRATSNSRSTVHHHSAIGVFLSRENMITRRPQKSGLPGTETPRITVAAGWLLFSDQGTHFASQMGRPLDYSGVQAILARSPAPSMIRTICTPRSTADSVACRPTSASASSARSAPIRTR